MTSPAHTAALGAAFAESLMSAACEITERPGEPVTDPETWEVTIPAGALIYAGKCHIRPAGGGATQVEGGEEFTYDFLVSIPAAVSGVTGGHLLTITASPDPDLIGITLEISKVDRGDYRTARRLQCNGMS